MMRLWKATNCTLFNEKYKISINATLQPSIKILNKCFCVSKDTKWVSSPVRFIAIWSSRCLKHVFLQNPRDPPLCFPEPWFGFPTLVMTHATTLSSALNDIYCLAIISFSLYLVVILSFPCWDKLTKLRFTLHC